MNAVPRSTYGHGFAANFDWPWCPPARRDQPIDLRIVLGSLGRFEGAHRTAYVPQPRAPARPRAVRVSRGEDGHYLFAYPDGAEFAIDAAGTEVFGVSRGALTQDDLLVYLQGPVLGFVLRLRGVICLHASAASLDGRAFGVLGRGGMGKSTSAAIFARLGVPVLTDDVLALHDRATAFDAQPGLPRVLLWPESVARLYGDADALPRIVGNWDKRYLDLTVSGDSFCGQAQPLGALYVLGERLAGAAATELTSLRGAGALMHLLANTYANDLLDADMRARELSVLGRLASHVAVRLVRAPEDPEKARDVCEAILADLRGTA